MLIGDLDRKLMKQESMHILTKNYLGKLKKKAIDDHDKFQELVFNREIINCDSKILRKRKVFDKREMLEKGNIFDWSAFQDKTIFKIGEVFSDHGVSWLKPFIYLMIVNILVAGYYSNSECCDIEYWSAFGQLLDPFSNPIIDAKNCGSDKPVLYILAGFQKLFYLWNVVRDSSGV